MKKRCLTCKKLLENSWQKKYCSNKCQVENQHNSFINAWKKGQKDGGMGISARNISAHVRKYLLEKYGRCFKCGWNKRNPITGRLALEVDHIDGDSENNQLENLRLLCPNCHALTESFKNLNRGKGRQWRMKKYIKNQ